MSWNEFLSLVIGLLIGLVWGHLKWARKMTELERKIEILEWAQGLEKDNELNEHRD